MSDIVRVLRIVEYVGPREAIESQIERSIHGTRRFPVVDGEVVITATTLGTIPELLGNKQPQLSEFKPRTLALIANSGTLPDSDVASSQLTALAESKSLDVDSFESWDEVAEAIEKRSLK